MRRLNNKGYLTVEIVVASVMAFAVAFFLMDLTIKLVNDTEDAYVDTILTNDKGLIIKNIRDNIENDCEKNSIDNFEEDEANSYIFTCNSGTIERWLHLEENASTNTYSIIYVDSSTGEEIYKKQLNNKFKNLTLTGIESGNYIYFKIAGENIFSNKDYDINIIIHK